MRNVLMAPVDLRSVMLCRHCRKLGRPLRRVWGRPTADGERNEREGRNRLMGCLVPPEGEPAAPYECRHCGADTVLFGRHSP